jgi:hypothetical protein
VILDGDELALLDNQLEGMAAVIVVVSPSLRRAIIRENISPAWFASGVLAIKSKGAS